MFGKHLEKVIKIILIQGVIDMMSFPVIFLAERRLAYKALLYPAAHLEKSRQVSSMFNGKRFSTVSTVPNSSNVINKAPTLIELPVQSEKMKVKPLSTRSSAVLTVSLSDSIRDKLSDRLLTETRSPYTNYAEITEKMEQILRDELPRDIQDIVSEMGITHEPKALLIKNCPVKKNPGPTPEEDRHCSSDGFLEEYLLLGMTGVRYCKPHHSPHKKSGELFTQIRAIKGSEKKASSQGNGQFFPLHVEEVNRTYGLDFLSLLCKKGDPNAATTILPVDTITRDLPDWMIKGMRKPIFAMKPGELWNGPKTPMIAPILELDYRGGFYIRYNAAKDRVEGLTPEAEKILQHLKELFDKGLEFEKVFLERGDCLTVSNKKVMHGRNAYIPSKSWDQRRDLVRLYETSNVDRIVSELIKSKDRLLVHGKGI